MGLPKGFKLGGRGCPECGAHSSVRIKDQKGRTGLQVCEGCGWEWVPCSRHCRGYRVELVDGAPRILGCEDCGVRTAIALRWAEAYRAAAALLNAEQPRDEAVVS